MAPEVRFEVLLPARWNGRLYMFGNGGYAGEALDNPGRVATGRHAVARGFAVAQTNTGHDAALDRSAASPPARRSISTTQTGPST
jgi:feruloyl esterase